MSIAVMQPYFFPYIGYFQLINHVDRFIIYDNVAFIKQGYINRNNILLEGKKHLITIPCRAISSNKLIKDVERISGVKSNNKLLKIIQSAYSKAPYFEEVYEIIASTINSNINSIADFNLIGISKICKYLDINTELIMASSIRLDMSQLNKVERLVNIAKFFDAKQYFNPMGGEKLYTKESFSEKGIELKFLEAKTLSYSQLNDNYPFVKNLSMIDVLMFNSKVKTKELLLNYNLH